MDSWGVLFKEGCAISNSAYHWRSVLCIMLIAGGGSQVKGVVIVVRVFVCDKGCKVGVVVYAKDDGRVE